MKNSVIPLLIIIFLYGCFSNVNDGDVEVGRVLSKSVIGIIDGRDIPLINIKKGSADFTEPYLNQFINKTDSNLIIDNKIEELLLKRYHEIKYVANIRLCIRDKNVEYILNRNDFNTMVADRIIKFKLYETDRSTIEKLLEH